MVAMFLLNRIPFLYTKPYKFPLSLCNKCRYQNNKRIYIIYYMNFSHRWKLDVIFLSLQLKSAPEISNYISVLIYFNKCKKKFCLKLQKKNSTSYKR